LDNTHFDAGYGAGSRPEALVSLCAPRLGRSAPGRDGTPDVRPLRRLPSAGFVAPGERIVLLEETAASRPRRPTTSCPLEARPASSDGVPAISVERL
jgi:hypothetical protein